jgi:hypothetical protein
VKLVPWVIAVVALVLSFTGGAVAAATITGKQIKDGSVTGKDVKTRSLLANDFKSGQLPRGPQGLPGPQGPAGPSLVGGSNLVSSAQVPYGPSDLVMTAIAFCPAGQRVISGGGVNIGDEQLAISMPTSDRSGWAVAGVDLVDNGGEYVQAQAICAPAGQAVAAGVRSHAEVKRSFKRLAAKVAPAGAVK